MRRITGAIAVLLILGLAAVGFSSAQKKTIDFIFGNGRFRFTCRIDLRSRSSGVAAHARQSRKRTPPTRR